MARVELGRAATYDDVVQAPEHLVAEIVDGELWTSPQPAPRQAHAHTVLGGVLLNAYGGGGRGPGSWRILYEPEVHLGRDVLVPDVARWRRERMPALPDSAWFDLAPDWVCEIISPSTALLDRTRKLRIYAQGRIAHAWILDPLARTLEVLRLDRGRWVVAATHGGAAQVSPEPFAGVALDLPLVWNERS